jgi:hypothetical protein|tara:strand:- start:283 stop:501 length:219 start_codon:yes stop_codon:yes gene_type:complete
MNLNENCFYDKDPQGVFENALTTGKLSRDEASENFVGNYMYMHSVKVPGYGWTTDHFKNINTRAYDVTAERA